MKYKAVLIIGPASIGDDEYNLHFKIKHLYASKEYKIIGDGKKTLTKNDFACLDGKINSETRIDIYAHGKNVYNVHFIQIISVSKTKNFLSFIANKANGDPLHIHLWSCHGGHAIADVSALPEGSVLVIHANKNEAVTDLVPFSLRNAILNLQSQSTSISPYQSFVYNMATDLVLPESISTMINGKVKHYKIYIDVTQILKNPEQTISRYLKGFAKFYKQIREEYQQIDVDAPPYISKATLLKAPVTTKKQYEDICLGNFLNHCILDNPDITDIAQSPAAIQAIQNIANNYIEDRTALITAVQFGRIKIAKFLIDNGANPNLGNSLGYNALYTSAQYNKVEVAELLLKNGADSNLVNPDSHNTALFEAALGNFVNMVKLLLKYKADPNLGPHASLVGVAYSGNIDIAELLLKCGANANASLDGSNVIEIAGSNQHFSLVKLLENFIAGAIIYAPEECPSHPDYIEHDLLVGAIGDFE